MPSRTFLVFLLFLLFRAPRRAAADEVAPELERADLRVRAAAELRRLVVRLPSIEQRRLTGVYVAFDPDAADPNAQVACDDDGDYVVVVSDAMLRLASHVAHASDDSHKIEDYAAFLARTQLPGRRLLPPPPGFFDPRSTSEAEAEERLLDVLSFVVARELVRVRAGDLVCPRPTATREAGDDVWTPAEAKAATVIATRLYPSVARDAEATARVLDAGRSERGARALERFFTELALDAPITLGRFAPSYHRLHGARP